MLNLIKYSSVRLREHNGTCVPRGPAIGKSRPVIIRFPQGSLEIHLPKHAPMRNESIEELKIVKDVEPLIGCAHSNVSMPSQTWEQAPIGNRKWAFYGPWFSGLMGNVNFYIEGLNLTKPNEKLNFLYPSGFECGVLGYLTAAWGHELYDEARSKAYYQSPINWTPLSFLPVPAVQLDVQETVTSGSRYRKVFFPVSSDKLIHIHFSYRQTCAGSQAEKDRKISPKPMQDLINNIIRSIRLTPYPELNAELEEIRKASPDLAISPECAPLEWPADVDKDGITILEYDKRRYATPNY
ncbi:hypothetical protein GNX18_18685 [Microbulbifer sp. SH-1]|uniref:hypothetical protein n=1 Tax=Microbulbifer sp. SH-1 TaxID=2681547 RepID=UPI0014079694|nr:hypothetical protein [Microbulbifer sp. SH-1]QIL91582.1 hypothetical protein GNX18_18685 [Microbulbifer sp. SH-1]